MKNKIFKFIFLPFMIAITLMHITGCKENIVKFNAMYQEGISEPIIIQKEDYLTLLNEKQSFILYIYSSTCSACKKFNDVINPFVEETSMVIYKIETYNIKEFINYNYTPALSIIKDGKVSTTINSNDQAKYFSSIDNFKEFVYRYVELEAS